MSTLHLVLKHHWFDKIKSGEKKTEYREATEYWRKRIMSNPNQEIKEKFWTARHMFVCLRRGYTKNAERLTFICSTEYLTHGKQTDLKTDKPVFAIHLHQKIDNDFGISGDKQ
jgi:hypothetical protein